MSAGGDLHPAARYDESRPHWSNLWPMDASSRPNAPREDGFWWGRDSHPPATWTGVLVDSGAPTSGKLGRKKTYMSCGDHWAISTDVPPRKRATSKSDEEESIRDIAVLTSRPVELHAFLPLARASEAYGQIAKLVDGARRRRCVFAGPTPTPHPGLDVGQRVIYGPVFSAFSASIRGSSVAYVVEQRHAGPVARTEAILVAETWVSQRQNEEAAVLESACERTLNIWSEYHSIRPLALFELDYELFAIARVGWRDGEGLAVFQLGTHGVTKVLELDLGSC